jgi:PAS domain-containing protein
MSKDTKKDAYLQDESSAGSSLNAPTLETASPPSGLASLAEENLADFFEPMLNGVAYCRMLHIEGKPTDLTYLYVNPAFYRLTGLGPVVGKRISEVIPGIQESTPEIFEIYGRVARGGPSENFEIYVEPLGRWLSIEVSTGKHCLPVSISSLMN